jgi:hypothetical protein
MQAREIRVLLDRVADTGQRLTVRHLVCLARLNRVLPLDFGFQVRVGQRFRWAGIPKTLPKYGATFLRACIDALENYDQLGERWIADVEKRVYVNRIVWLAGLSPRERRYLGQLYGLDGFSQFRVSDLAQQDQVTSAYVCRIQATFQRKLKAAVVLSELPPPERRAPDLWST